MEEWYITESKTRCKQMGMDPSVIPSFSCRLTDEELKQRSLEYEEILSAVDLLINKMLDLNTGKPLLYMITDAKGCILDMAGDQSIKSMVQELGINKGLQFREEDAGTNAINLALMHQRPVQMIGENHYHQFLRDSACYSVPFQYTDEKNVLGTINIMTSAANHHPFLFSMLCTLVDSIERELLLRKQNSRLDLLNQVVIDSTKNGIIVTDKDGYIIEHNVFAQKITGWNSDSLSNKHIRTLKPMGEYIYNLLKKGKKCENIELVFNQGIEEEQVVCLFDAFPIYDRNSQLIGAFGQFRDITERYKAEAKINYLAYHDDLTDLPNRRALIQKLKEKLNEAEDNKDIFAIMFLDLDRFKIVNDTMGHSNGDLLLKMVAHRLKRCIGSRNLVARRGGDEFTILLSDIKNVNDVKFMASNIISEFAKPFIIDGYEFYITASIGVAFYPHDGKDIEALLKYADIAMYQAKDKGKNNYVMYKPARKEIGLERVTLESSLHKALHNEEFMVYYQPQVNITTGEIVGLEALIRWHHPKHGIISPATFIPVAEETGLIVPIGEWVLKTACQKMKEWIDAGLPFTKVSVNLSTRQFLTQNIVQVVSDVLDETKLQPHNLVLEITESMTMDVDYAIQTLKELKKLGVQVSIDDFGTGYSSLYYLKKFSVNQLKIDQSFIRDLMIDSNDRDIVNTIIAMAHNLGIKVIAEGVENEEQLEFLKNQKCDEVQGFLFYRPLPSREIELLLQKESSTTYK